jgi:S-adenosylmethionine:tRNA ribosyltransferase-isomerase
VKTGSRLELIGDAQQLKVTAEVVEVKEEGIRVITFSDETLLTELGQIPLPPYIHLPLKDPERYQTVYANTAGSVAAPTAGLHFTPELMERIEAKGVRCLFITLHIGLDTFLPVRESSPAEHPIHREYGILSQEVADALSQAKREEQRIISVGTTTVRLVEAAAQASSPADMQPFEGWVNLFILPGYRFRVVAALITNFHLPQSTLLMLVTAFAGRNVIDKAYQEAIAQKYRFYSFGDAMLIL